jgi:hypothetical protein
MLRPPAVPLLSCLAAVLCLTSCSTGPAPAKPGTPEWYWMAANEQAAAGDLVKTQEHLEKVGLSDNPFKARAAIWHLVMSGGMALGYKDLAQAYEDGSTLSKTQSGDLRRRANDCVRLSKQYCMVLAEELGRLHKESADAAEFALEFTFPQGSAVEDTTLGRIRKGTLPPAEELAKAERSAIKRGVLLATASVVGAGDDTAKTYTLFQTKPVKVPRAVFLYGIADGLVEESKIFDRKRLNEPDKKKLVLQLASDCLKPASQSDDAALKKKAKALGEKVAKEQKSLPKGV